MKRSTTVSQALIEELQSGVYSVGDVYPAESDLCSRFKVSRSTVRYALARMQDLGLIQRRQGAPTRVTATAVPPVYIHSMTASGDLLNFAGPTRREIREVTHIVADEDLAAKMNQNPGRHWILIRQARYVGATKSPVVWTDVYLEDSFEDIVEDLPGYPGLIYTLIEQRHGIVIDEIRQTIIGGVLTEELAHVFDETPGAPAMEVVRSYNEMTGNCRMVTISTQPATSFKYEITLSRQGN